MYRLPQPFLVVATQNPIEHHGTHPLPESQLDRFLLRLRLGYPEAADEAAVLRDDPAATELPRLQPVIARDDLLATRAASERVEFGSNPPRQCGRVPALEAREERERELFDPIGAPQAAPGHAADREVGHVQGARGIEQPEIGFEIPIDSQLYPRQCALELPSPAGERILGAIIIPCAAVLGE